MDYKKKTFIGLGLFEQMHLVRKVGTHFPNNKSYILSRLAAAILIVALSLPFFRTTDTAAQSTIPLIRRVRSLEADEIGLAHPAGLTFSNRGQTFQVVDAVQMSFNDTDLVQLSALAERAGSVRLAASVQNPLNITFDSKSNRLLFFSEPAGQLVTMQAYENGSLNPAGISRYDVKAFGLHDPQGLVIDEKTGMLFILDAAGPRIVQVTPASDGSFNGAGIMEIDLGPNGFSGVRGIAYHPSSGNLFVVNPLEKKLYELSRSGQLVMARDLAQFNLIDPQAIAFAPSGDQTDDPAQMSLYIADSGIKEGTNQISVSQDTGQIVEFSWEASVEPAAASFTASLIRTTDMAALSPPSPDPSGVAFLPNSNTLMVVDGEVDETVNGATHFQGVNVWELTLLGSKVRTANISKRFPTVTPMTNEPTGVAWNPNNGHFYITDDNDARVYELNPGGDGLVGTADDTWTYFSTLNGGSGDPEGITFNTWNNHIFVSDGVNAEVYEFTISGDLVSQFDVQQHGIRDPEGIEFNSEAGTLYIMSSERFTPVIVETTTSGALLQTIDISAVNPIAVAGLVYAPASDGSGSKRFFIVDRGIDNNDDPEIIDGKMYEVTAPISSVQTPTFADVPTIHPYYDDIEILYANGLTAGCGTNPLRFCPDQIMDRAMASVFMVRGAYGAGYVPNPITYLFKDDWSKALYARPWAEAMREANLTTGCKASPLLYCPLDRLNREQAVIFGLKMKYGNYYQPPPATGTVFADMTNPGYWAAPWVEKAYADGLITACGQDAATGKPKFCPKTLVTRGLGAYIIVRAKNLSVTKVHSSFSFTA